MVVLHNTGDGLNYHTPVQGMPNHYYKGQQASITCDQLTQLLAGTQRGEELITCGAFYHRWQLILGRQDRHPGPQQTGMNCASISVLESTLYAMANHDPVKGAAFIKLF